MEYLRLTIAEWNLVEKQCRDCLFWNDAVGCVWHDSDGSRVDPIPDEDCGEKITRQELLCHGT